MAKILYPRHSSDLHLKTVNRHVRLCHQIQGADFLADAIQTDFSELIAKVAETAKTVETYEVKYDQVVLNDAVLDDSVRNLSEASKRYDRTNPGESTYSLLFPDKLSAVIYAPVKSEPIVVEQLILRIGGLGENHELATHIEPLQQAIDNCKTAIAELNEAILAVKNAEALEEIAKMKVERQYEQNVYAASAKFGKSFTSRLFPSISTPVKSKAVEEIAE